MGDEIFYKLNKAGILKFIPSLFAWLLGFLSLLSLYYGSTVLKNLCLILVLLTVCLHTFLAYHDFGRSFFWLLNSFSGWVVPLGVEIVDHVKKNVKKGDAKGVVDAIDSFCWAGKLIMNVGDVKGALVDKEIINLGDKKEKVLVELGAHIGYSTVRFARLLKEGDILYSVDPEPLGHSIACFLTHHAEVADKVEQIYGYSTDFLKQLSEEGKKIDLLFIDHVKTLYLSDLKLAMALGVLKKGSVVVADNIVFPGAPEYKKWMLSEEGKKAFDTKVLRTNVEYSKTVEDEVLVSIYKHD